MKEYRRMQAGTTGNRFSAVITVEIIDDVRVEWKEVWRCKHEHLDHPDAQHCAEKKLRKMASVA